MASHIGTKFPTTPILTTHKDTGRPHATSLAEWGQGKRVVLFTLPGAFTPTCTAKHLPDYISHADDFRQKGIDTLGCMAVNDIFVMAAWARANDAKAIDMLADTAGAVTQALAIGLGSHPILGEGRAGRTAFIAENGVITHFYQDAAGEYQHSSAPHVLGQI
ncbi:MAG: peroxiredoxin [Proteobacteria bacterium]|nr:peroxiredoxin [Pseudomonadota bacterium]